MIAPNLTSRFVHPDALMLTCIVGWGGHYSVPAVEPPDHFFEDEDAFGEIH
jgi:hypothetical protein